MAEADPEWLLWAKKQKDNTQTLAKQVEGQGRIIDELLSLRGEVKGLQHEIKSIRKDASSARQAGEDSSALAEQIQHHSKVLESLQKQMEGPLEVKSLRNDLSLLQKEQVDTTVMAERIQDQSRTIDELLPLREQVNELRNEIQCLEKKPRSAQQAEQNACAQHGSDIFKANLRIIKLEADKRAQAKEAEQFRAQTARSIADLQQHIQNAHYQEIAQLRTQCQQQTEEVASLRLDCQRLLAALEQHKMVTSDPQVDVQMVNLTSQAPTSNSSDCSRTTDSSPDVQRVPDANPLRHRNWSGEAQLRSPIRCDDDDETRDDTASRDQSTSVSSTTEIWTTPHGMHIEIEQPTMPSVFVLEPQGNRPLDEYITCSQDTISPLLLAYEANIVRVFIAGLQDKEHRATMRRRLDENIWTWKVAFEEISRIDREAREPPKTTNPEQPITQQPRTRDGRFAKRKRRM